MKKYFLTVGVLLLLAVPSWAQSYEGKHDMILNSMDRAAVEHNDLYSNVPIPGAKEDVKPQDVRYDESTEPLDMANERHFNETANIETIIEKSEK